MNSFNDYFNQENMNSKVGYTGNTPVSSEKSSEKSEASNERDRQRIGDLIHHSFDSKTKRSVEISFNEVSHEDLKQGSSKNPSRITSNRELAHYKFDLAQEQARPILENILASSYATP
jgi:hypothetical protein